MTFVRGKAAILGATGPTGKHLTRALVARGVKVRVISRSEEGLRQAFASLAVERRAADACDAEATRNALADCDLVFDCIGLPLERIADHPVTARNVASAVEATGARCVLVSSYWSYIPIHRLPVSEQHPRQDGNRIVRARRQAEDVLRRAGAVVVQLPDFYGPEVHTSTLQQALDEAARNKPVHWIGSLDTEREYAFVPDAIRTVIELADREEAAGERWIVPGAGPLSAARMLEIAGRHLGRTVRGRPAGRLLLRVVSWFSRPLRAFLPMMPTYLAPIAFDTSKIEALLGPIEVTPYERAIPWTLDWIATAHAGA